MERADQFAEARTSPGIVLPGAYGQAFASLSSLPVYGGAWREVTNRPYDSDDVRYRDPSFSNSGGGSGIVSGRMTGIAVGGNYLYGAGANGGVFRSGDGGTTWTALTDLLPTLSVGDIRIAPDGALWLATGEANTGATSYVGSGVYRLASPQTGVFSSLDRVGGAELESTMINKLRFDGVGAAYAATSRGVWKHDATTKAGGWRRVAYPVADPIVNGVAHPELQSPYANICNDVVVQPGTAGQRVLANCAWRGGAAYNGFYASTDFGETFTLVNPAGALNPQDVGNSTFAFAADGTRLYAVVESVTRYVHTANTVLSGVYVSNTGAVAGPWNKIADSQKLAGSGSALKLEAGYRPGVQAWYNQSLDVDPNDPNHVFVGLEEVFETSNGGTSWQAIAPYWNFGFSCYSPDPTKNTCPSTPHSDQHSIAFGNGRVYVGNDGGLYSRPIRGQVNADGHGIDWVSHNANLRTLQYYSVGVGRVPNGFAVFGGLQDNGSSLLLPEDTTGNGRMGSPMGGDGTVSIVDENDGCKILGGYVFLSLWLTENCGRSSGLPGSIRDVSPGDPGSRFIAPTIADSVTKDHWVAGGQFVWSNPNGFRIQSGAGWLPIFDNGVGHATTALASQNDIVYSAWCGPCNNVGFTRGISTNAGGTFHQLTLPADLPNRYVSSVAMDPADPTGMTAFVGLSGFSRAWTEGPGVGLGHLWKTTDGGQTWANISGNLPDVPVNDVVVRGSKLVLGTDLGAVISTDGGGHWSRLGSNLPYTTVLDLHMAVDGKLYAATFGRGLWSISAP